MSWVGPWTFLYIVFLHDFFTAGANLYSEPNTGSEIEENEGRRKRDKKKKIKLEVFFILVHSDKIVLCRWLDKNTMESEVHRLAQNWLTGQIHAFI